MSFVAIVAGCSSGSTEKVDKLATHDSSDSMPATQGDMGPEEDTNLVDFDVSLAGWYGDTAVMNELEWYESGDTKETFHLMHLDGSYVELKDDPSVLSKGIDISPAKRAKSDLPRVELVLDVDTVALRNMENGLSELSPTDALPEPIPALAILLWRSSEDAVADTLLQDSIRVGPYYGESAIEYVQPYVDVAELSPGHKTLFVGIRIADKDEYHVFDVSSSKKK